MNRRLFTLLIVIALLALFLLNLGPFSNTQGNILEPTLPAIAFPGFSLYAISYTSTNNSSLLSHYLYAWTSNGIVKISETGETLSIINNSGESFELQNDELYLIDSNRKELLVYDLAGEFLRAISIPPPAVGNFLQLAVLTDGRFAFMDNKNDKVYFTDPYGNLLAIVNILEQPDDRLQNLQAVVVGNRFILSEDGNKRLLQIDLTTYTQLLFRDLSNLSDAWLGSITYANGQYYICGPNTIYKFTEDGNITQVAQMPPDVYNITGIEVINNIVYVSINFSGEIRKVDLNSGTNTILVSGLNGPKDLQIVTTTPIPTPTDVTTPLATNTPKPTTTATSVETPILPTNTPISTPLPTEQGGTWQTESFAAANGRWASLALDSTGNPHFSYHRDGLSFNNLWYAHRTGSGWVTEVVDTGYEAGSLSTSLALNAVDHPYILYQFGGRDVHPESLKYAYQAMSGWIIETIGIDTYGSTLALDTNGNPHITYSQTGGDKYAYKTSNDWSLEQIDRAGSSLVLDSDNNPHITYIASGEVKYAHRTANGWIIETVNTIGSGIDTTSGQKVALALDKVGNPYVSYNFVNGSQNELKYAYRTASGWVTETVDSDTNLHSVGWDSSIATDSTGNPRISYDRIDLGVVKYAWRTERGWSTEIVARFGLNTYSETSLVLDNADNPHMIYYQDSGLIYAYKKGQGTNSISGQVTDSSGHCTDQVTVATNTGKSTLTHSDGKYTIASLVAGTYTLTASKNSCTYTSPAPVTVPPDAFDQNFTGTLIRPLPVVLVHGWNDTAASWDTYVHEFLPSIGLTTRYAVDSIDTGAGGHTPASIDENAKRLQGYIERVKRETGATQVNIVAHSMGGLITRRYIKEYMNADTPDINQLIMLGTPNKGLNLARALELSGIPGLWPTTKELTESFIDNFNAANPVPDNVRFYAIAGNYYCLNKFPFIRNPNEEQPNDIAVSRKSVFAIPEQGRWTFPDKQTAGCGGDHRGMRSKEPFDGGKDIFDLYVGPLLLGQMPVIPSEPQTLVAQQTANGQTDQLQSDSNDLDTLQFTTVQTSTLQPGGRLEFSQIPEPAITIGFIVIGQPEQMIISLRDPGGQVIASNTTNPNVQYMQMDAGFMPITSYTISNPIPGIWTTIIEANAQTPSTGVGVAALGSLVSNLRLTLPVFENARVIHQTVNVTAKLHKGDTPIIGANVNAQFLSPDGEVTSITLLDDGLHGDSSAGDGLYGYQFTPMTPGVYSALIRAEGMNKNVAFQRRDVWAVQVDGNQVFLPLVLR